MHKTPKFPTFVIAVFITNMAAYTLIVDNISKETQPSNSPNMILILRDS